MIIFGPIAIFTGVYIIKNMRVSKLLSPEFKLENFSLLPKWKTVVFIIFSTTLTTLNIPFNLQHSQFIFFIVFSVFRSKQTCTREVWNFYQAIQRMTERKGEAVKGDGVSFDLYGGVLYWCGFNVRDNLILLLLWGISFNIPLPGVLEAFARDTHY